jgi:hypothetical protein
MGESAEFYVASILTCEDFTECIEYVDASRASPLGPALLIAVGMSDSAHQKSRYAYS